MKFSENWLREWVDPAVDTGELCRQLTMAGLEVDTVAPAAGDLAGVVVGAIEAVDAHPDADKLTVCEVDCGAHGRRQIVCGAPNARVGLKAPVALSGVHLPNGVTVEAAELRGVQSDGMLCASNELGLSEDGAGLFELDADAEPGSAITSHLALNDQIIEIDLTPNRGDCLSLRGVAREVGVWNRLSVTNGHATAVESARKSGIAVTIDDNESCPAYVGRSIFGIDPDARTPDWMCERLRRSGIRPIFPVVDVTNYVMLELGQPMHAFDQKALDGNITVRRAASDEHLTLLDETEVALAPETLMIADATGPVAMAGVMGGARTGVTADTQDIFLESACFTPLAVAGQGRRYKIHTDSLHRFERGVDPVLQVRALERATHLIQSIAGGEAGTTIHAGQGASEGSPVLLRPDRIERILGTRVEEAEVVDILERLEMAVTSTDSGWWITPPSHRYDIAFEADLIEEIARIHGYDQLPSQAHPVYAAPATDRERIRPISAIREILRQRGYDEAITYSFVDPELQGRLSPDEDSLELDNPIADNLARMRTTLWASLIPCWLHNIRRQQKRVRMFETGLRFWRDAAAPLGVAQQKMLAGFVYGPAQPEHWDHRRSSADFFDAKGDVEALFVTGATNLEFRAEPHPALHPGRCASVHVDGEPAGWLGQLHPDFAKFLDIRELPYVFELEYEKVRRRHIPHVAEVSDFPSVRRDLAFTVAESTPVGTLLDALWQLGEPLLQHVSIFDVFTGGDLDTGFKSVALGLIFQDKTGTLTAEGVDVAVARLIQQAQACCGAVIRGQ